MSDDERRPRRILADNPTNATQAQALLRLGGWPPMQQRFLRALGPTADAPALTEAALRAPPDRFRYDGVATASLLRVDAPVPPPPATAAPPQHATTPPSPRSRPREPSPAPRPRPPRTRVTTAAPTTGADRQAPEDNPAPAEPAQAMEAWRLAGLAGPAPAHWDGELADRIALLCRRAPSGWSSWSVTVALDPAVLPQTDLRLTLSLQRLALCFHTHSVYSQGLIERHRERLDELLRKALPGERDIDIESM